MESDLWILETLGNIDISEEDRFLTNPRGGLCGTWCLHRSLVSSPPVSVIVKWCTMDFSAMAALFFCLFLCNFLKPVHGHKMIWHLRKQAF